MRKPTEPFATFIDSFMVAKTLAPTTREDYTRYLRDFDKFTGHTSLKAALTLDNAAQWVDGVRSRGVHTARNGAMALKSMATWIAKSRHVVIPGGGSLLAGLECPRVPKGTRRAFSDKEMDAVRQALEFRKNKDRARARAAVLLMAESGLRRNEARQLIRGDLLIKPDLSATLRVRAVTSKGQKERTVRVGGDAVQAVMAYIDSQQRPDYSGPKSQSEPMFLTEQGREFTKNGWGTWLDRIWDDIEKLSGIKASSHWLRHKWASDYARFMHLSGNNVYDLKREGGWSDLNIPLHYAHDRPQEELDAMPTPIDEARKRRRLAV